MTPAAIALCPNRGLLSPEEREWGPIVDAIAQQSVGIQCLQKSRNSTKALGMSAEGRKRRWVGCNNWIAIAALLDLSRAPKASVTTCPLSAKSGHSKTSLGGQEQLFLAALCSRCFNEQARRV